MSSSVKFSCCDIKNCCWVGCEIKQLTLLIYCHYHQYRIHSKRLSLQCFLSKHLHRFCRTILHPENVPAGMHKLQNMSESIFWLFLRNTLQAIKVINRRDGGGGEKPWCCLNPTLHAPVILQASFFKASLHFPGFSHFSKGNELKVQDRCVVNYSYYHYRPKIPPASCNPYTKFLSLGMVYSMI